MVPYISGYASIPKGLLNSSQVEKLKKMATVTPKVFSKRKDNEEPPKPIFGWRETPDYLHLPIMQGIASFRAMGFEHKFEDRTCKGYPITTPRLPDPHHENASRGQAEFLEKVLKSAKGRPASLNVAGTGNGKTVVALAAIARLGRTALVVVPGTVIAKHWLDEIKLHLGLTDDEIGWVQGPKCDFKGKKIVIAVVHSLCKKAYSPAFYQYFGTIVYDEVHGMAAETFSRTMGKLPARHKLAFSASPKNKTGTQNLFLNYFGRDFVEAANDPPMPCTAFVVDYELPFDPDHFPNDRNLAINILSKLKSRNLLLLKWINKLYIKNRTILVIGDRIPQLCFLRNICHEKYGIPLEHMCIYAGQEEVNGKRVTISIKELQRRKKDGKIRIYFATYGVFKQGENIPRLNAGIEATPRADGTQPPGRIRRRLKNKVTPIWVSVRDKGSWLLAAMTKSRINEFKLAKIKVCEQ